MDDALAIIIPVLNRVTLLPRLLDSIAAQSYRPLEVIIVDNGSTDGTQQAAQTWAEFHNSDRQLTVTLLSEKQRGAAHARATGAAHATSHHLVFFDSDDTMRPEFATEIMRCFKIDPRLDMVYWRKMMHLTPTIARLQKFKHHRLMANHVYHSLFSTEGCAVSKAFYNKCSGWNTSLLQWDDWELGLRYITSPDIRIRAIDRLLIDSYAQTESITGDSFLPKRGSWERAIDAAEHHAATLPEKQRRQLMRLLAFKRAVLAGIYTREGDSKAGKATLRDALSRLPNDRFARIMLQAAYRYTAIGLRGAAALFGRFF